MSSVIFSPRNASKLLETGAFEIRLREIRNPATPGTVWGLVEATEFDSEKP